MTPEVTVFAPSTIRRATARISAIVMSAVSSVRTPGVLVTVMPRRRADTTSMLSTPLPKLAISFICSPACAISGASILSVTVGTRTSASRMAAASSVWDMGASDSFSRASNSSRMRVSIMSGSLRVTMTSGFLRTIVLVPFSPRGDPPRDENLPVHGALTLAPTKCASIARSLRPAAACRQ